MFWRSDNDKHYSEHDGRLFLFKFSCIMIVSSKQAIN